MPGQVSFRFSRLALVVLGVIVIAIVLTSGYSGYNDKWNSEWLPAWRLSRHPTAGGINQPSGESPTFPHTADLIDPNLRITPPPTPGIDNTHREIFSNRTIDGKFFFVDFDYLNASNTNIIPHPNKPQHWFVIGQRTKGVYGRFDEAGQAWFTQLVCLASFKNNRLRCNEPPMMLPVALTSSEKCTEQMAWWNFNMGPHDARVFMGPDRPYIMYGSQSKHNCFGIFMHDFRLLVDWPNFIRSPDDLFDSPLDIPRPPPIGAVEKNYFAFWDKEGNTYIHYDIAPKRSFAKIEADGNITKDLAVMSQEHDAKCIAKLMPKLIYGQEELKEDSIHQATNSLSITMCNKKTDPDCVATDENTFIATIFQHKFFFEFHGWYEPYVALFHARAPFELYGISSKPLFIHGRTHNNAKPELRSTSRTPNGHTEMFYVTSMNWAEMGKHYHGYLDDEIFVGFGIEDAKTAGIDVRAEELLANIEKC